MNNNLSVSQSKASESSFIAKVYLWMSAGLAISALSAFWLLITPTVFTAIVKNPFILYGLMIGTAVLAIWGQTAAFRISTAALLAIFGVYSMVTGITLALIFLAYTGPSIISTFAVTAGTFLFFGIFGYTTKKDLTGLAALAGLAFLGLIIASIVNIFTKSSTFDLVISFIGVAISIVLIAWKHQDLKNIYAMGVEDEEIRKKQVLLGAFYLYISLINLFMFLLRIFGRRRD